MLPRNITNTHIWVGASASCLASGTIAYLTGGWDGVPLGIVLGSAYWQWSIHQQGTEEEINRLRNRIFEIENTSAPINIVNSNFDYNQDQMAFLSRQDDHSGELISKLNDRVFELEMAGIADDRSDRIYQIECDANAFWEKFSAVESDLSKIELEIKEIAQMAQAKRPIL